MAAKAQAVLLLSLVASLAAALGAQGICNMSNGDFKLCQPAAAGVAGFWMRIYHIDAARAMALPGKCGLTMPTNCS
uniref:Bifunctional inhibitor/plant lipid transfer protein/seed storage helical domain-containing protein n=1 Tax=Oryza sativa subsp. japonica TaxID=39947 RepID=Q7XHZ6_ORYSJ|nr:unknown protein [Oryza sativa Japonica Group]BAC84406.1 unknown protein [Oryza sativa Japonica Group]